MRGEGNKNVDTKFRRTSQQNMRNVMANCIHEVLYKNCLKELFQCSAKTSIPRYFSNIHHSDLYAQIIYVLHEKKASIASSVLMSFSASWPSGLGINLPLTGFLAPWPVCEICTSCTQAVIWITPPDCQGNSELVDAMKVWSVTSRYLWDLVCESTGCMTWTLVHKLPQMLTEPQSSACTASCFHKK